ILLHDLDAETFADIYAQTIAYGMFAARLHDPTPDDFSRQEAATLVPKSNPFLRSLFVTIAAVDLDDRVAWVVDDLADVFRTVDLKEILADFGKATAQEDPFMHFYETFLAAYDPALRKGCGVYYTPAPVVRFIVRAVDHLLKTSFGLPNGLADSSQIVRQVPAEGDFAKGGKDKLVERSFHKVQILDIAAGTGTFLAEVVRHIRESFAGQEGLWPAYVENDLIPRINGFEILMASYAICHLKLELLLRQTGYDPQSLSRRLNVFLTNSLEEADPATGTLFASWLSREAREANRVKRDTPVMVVIGNPPYAVSSVNNSDWIVGLLNSYKKELEERNIQPLSDDYITFIRMGQHYIEKNGQAIRAYISANSFLDGIIHRQMRLSLMEGFDDIFILDLHGNAKKKETAPDGSKDENVVDIMTGVSINLFVKTGKKASGQLAAVHHHEIFGRRKQKYETLETADFASVPWKILKPGKPRLFFVPKDFSNQSEYEQGFLIEKLFPLNTSGIKTQKDDASISFSDKECDQIANDLVRLSVEEIRSKYGFSDVRDWTVAAAKADIGSNPIIANPLLYRPFDIRFMNYTGTTKGVMGYPRIDTMKHMLKDNVGMLLVPQPQAANLTYFDCIFISKLITDTNAYRRGGPFIFPLFLYSDDGSRTPNLDSALVEKIAAGLGLRFVPEATGEEGTFSPLDLLDYIYAVLHTPSYREKYKEFLKIDFPRVPYPADAAQFRQLAAIGAELRGLHLMESPKLAQAAFTFPVAGDNVVDKPVFKDGQVWINQAQYVGNVPEDVWMFTIGGYQPAQKWLKDRKGRVLSYDDIRHYQKILGALAETGRLMTVLDEMAKDWMPDR
ncbi:MAG: type ISP restriction/modification enzyme, partial [Syntrophales bacterium]